MDNLVICACCHLPIEVPLDKNGQATPDVVAYHSAQECPTCHCRVHAYCLHDGVCTHCYNKTQIKTAGMFCSHDCPLLSDQIGCCRHYADASRLKMLGGKYVRCDECLKEFG
jgi:hypothetical protein